MPRRPYHHGDLRNALIRAGAELLASEGAGGLTLRKAARRAGVSHAAPYAHFADKQALVAAISTEGLRTVRERIEAAARRSGEPLARLEEAAWQIVRFGLAQPDLYRVTFSSAIDRERDHPEYQAMAHATFAAVERLVRSCQAGGVLDPGPADVAAVGLWSLVHGLVSLLINRQLPRRMLARRAPRTLLRQALAPALRVSRRA